MQEIVKKKSSTTLAKRVENLEAEIAALKQQLQQIATGTPAQADPNWWKSAFGVFKDDPGFDEVVRLGRKWRQRQPKC